MRSRFAPLIAGALMALTALPAAALDVGDPFPELILPTLDGDPLSVASFRGQKVALHVWASW
ncbi:MAG: hypothetical protein AAGM22_14265 [Acidobacteriota bacterium]